MSNITFVGLSIKKKMRKHVLCALNSGIGRNTYSIWCISQRISITTRSSIRARNGILLQEKGKFDRLPRRDMHCEKTWARKDTVYYGHWDTLASTAHEHSQGKHFLLTYARLHSLPFICPKHLICLYTGVLYLKVSEIMW